MRAHRLKHHKRDLRESDWESEDGLKHQSTTLSCMFIVFAFGIKARVFVSRPYPLPSLHSYISAETR